MLFVLFEKSGQKMIIDTTDPNKDIVRIEYSKPLSDIINKESVVLKIETKV